MGDVAFNDVVFEYQADKPVLKGHLLSHRFLGVVMQDNFLFDRTIRENIAFSKPDATDAEIREAARIAHCDEFVDRFDEKYDTIVGEWGVKLSGGQGQQVGIARAIRPICGC